MRPRSFLSPLAAITFMALLVLTCVHMPTYAPQNPAVRNEMHSGEYRDAVSDYHDRAVVDHYDQHFRLGLTEAENNDLVEFLKSL